MIIHLQEFMYVPVQYLQQARSEWKRHNIVPHMVRACTGLMVLKKHKKSLTSNAKKVTCKRCLKKIAAGDVQF